MRRKSEGTQRATARCVAARAAYEKAKARLDDARTKADAALDALNAAIVECQRLGARTRTGVRP